MSTTAESDDPVASSIAKIEQMRVEDERITKFLDATNDRFYARRGRIDFDDVEAIELIRDELIAMRPNVREHHHKKMDQILAVCDSRLSRA